ncbi:MAG: hypothetical protein R2704_17460 [Microthrixaceae bacterium]
MRLWSPGAATVRSSPLADPMSWARDLLGFEDGDELTRRAVQAVPTLPSPRPISTTAPPPSAPQAASATSEARRVLLATTG